MLHTSSQRLSAKVKEGWSVLSASKQTYLRHKTGVADMLQLLSADWNRVAQAWTAQDNSLSLCWDQPMACWQILTLGTLWQVCWHESAHSTFQTQRRAKVHQPRDQTLCFNTTKRKASELQMHSKRSAQETNYWWLQVWFMVWYQRQLASVLGHQLWPLTGQGEEQQFTTAENPDTMSSTAKCRGKW